MMSLVEGSGLGAGIGLDAETWVVHVVDAVQVGLAPLVQSHNPE